MKRNNLLVIFVILFAFFSFTLYAAGDSTEDTAQGIFHSFMSPYCPGKLISDCPSEGATELKQQVREKLSKGQSRESVIEDLNKEFGAQVLQAAPTTTGWGLVGWIIPGIFIVIGIGIVSLWLKTNSEVIETPDAATDLSKDLEERIKKDLL